MNKIWNINKIKMYTLSKKGRELIFSCVIAVISIQSIDPKSFSRLPRPVDKINILTRDHMRASICVGIRITEFRFPSEAPVTSFANPSGPLGQKASDATETTINPLRSDFDGERRRDRSIGRERETGRAVRRRENDDGDGDASCRGRR